MSERFTVTVASVAAVIHDAPWIDCPGYVPKQTRLRVGTQHSPCEKDFVRARQLLRVAEAESRG